MLLLHLVHSKMSLLINESKTKYMLSTSRIYGIAVTRSRQETINLSVWIKRKTNFVFTIFPMIGDRLMLLYRVNTWKLLRSDATDLEVFERKILLKIFGWVHDWCSAYPKEERAVQTPQRYERYLTSTLVLSCHLNKKRYFKGTSFWCGRGRREQPCLCWKTQMV